ncbi:MAG TPA: hypothetical protein VHM65_00095 [Candidatus Lustribacter sp.]|nr:hypothetical protein [Candidatus Lustribacter sp.]
MASSRRARTVRTRLVTGVSSAAVVLAAAVMPLAPGAAVAVDGRTATLVGSLQSELGCGADWDPGCEATTLTAGEGTSYAKTFDVPAGSYELKLVINHAWDENYGAGGAMGGANIPVVLGGPASLTFTYDDTSHRVAITTTSVAGAVTGRTGGSPGTACAPD